MRQFGASRGIVTPGGQEFVALESVRPARIAKQMVSMFIAAQTRSLPPQLDWLRRFVLDRDGTLPADNAVDSPQLYLYRNSSRSGRIVPVTSIMELFAPGPVEERSAIFSEVSWPPVGLVLCLQGREWLERRGLVDITEWGRRSFDTIETTRVLVSTFTIESDHPLGFGSVSDVERWREERGVVWAIADGDDPSSPTSTSMVWRLDR